MLEHDKYWNWSVKKGDKVRSDVTRDGLNDDKFGKISLIEGEEYEIVVPQGTPNGICVKNSNNQKIWGEHDWFTKI